MLPSVSGGPGGCLISFDDFVGAKDHGFRYRQPQRFCGLEIQKKFKFCRLFDRQVGRVSSFENFVHILRRLAARRHHAQSRQNARPSGKGRLPMSPSTPMGKYRNMLKRLDATAAMNSPPSHPALAKEALGYHGQDQLSITLVAAGPSALGPMLSLAANDNSKSNYNLGSCTAYARSRVGQQLPSE
jgi:hypothetical protein